MYLLKRIVVVFSVLMFFAVSVTAESSDLTVTKIADNVYCLKGMKYDVSSVFIVSDEGVVVVDAGNNVEEGRAIVKAVKSKTDKPVKYVVLTHYHNDHVMGLKAFPAGVKIVAQANCKANMEASEKMFRNLLANVYPQNLKKLKKEIAGIKDKNSKRFKELQKNIEAVEFQKKRAEGLNFVIPDSTFKDKRTLFTGKNKIDIVFEGNTHTNDSVYVHIPAAKVLIMGDMLFNSFHPYIDWRKESDTERWIKVLNRLGKMDIDKVVPGHGKPGGREILLKKAEYLKDLRAEVKKVFDKGESLDSAKKSVKMQKYSGFSFGEYLPLSVEGVYMEYKRKKEAK